MEFLLEFQAHTLLSSLSSKLIRWQSNYSYLHSQSPSTLKATSSHLPKISALTSFQYVSLRLFPTKLYWTLPATLYSVPFFAKQPSQPFPLLGSSFSLSPPCFSYFTLFSSFNSKHPRPLFTSFDSSLTQQRATCSFSYTVNLQITIYAHHPPPNSGLRSHKKARQFLLSQSLSTALCPRSFTEPY